MPPRRPLTPHHPLVARSGGAGHDDDAALDERLRLRFRRQWLLRALAGPTAVASTRSTGLSRPLPFVGGRAILAVVNGLRDVDDAA